MKQQLLRLLRVMARPFFGRGLWKAPVLRSIASWYKRSYHPEYVSIEGVRFYLNYNDAWFSTYVAVHGYWEKMETEAIRAHVRPGMRVLDIGAHIGYYTIVLSNLVGETGRVTAFEPAPGSYALLCKNTQDLPHRNVELVQRAVWRESGELQLHINSDDTLDHSIVAARDRASTVTIQAVSIDDYMGDATFDCVKMDIQGGEGHALRGMAGTLERHRPDIIVTEFWPSALDRAGTPAIEFFDQLLALGYDIHWIDEERQTIEPTTWEILQEAFRGKDWKFFNLLCLQRAPD